MISLLPYADWLHSEYFVDNGTGFGWNWSIKPGAPPKVQKAYELFCKNMEEIRRLESETGIHII